MTAQTYTDEQIEEAAEHLSSGTPNWYRETFGDWKSYTTICDRAPKVAADMLRSLLAERQAARSVVVSEEDVFEHLSYIGFSKCANGKYAPTTVARARASLESFAKSHGVAGAVKLPDADAKDAARWRFLCENVGEEYGDGYTEPRENSLVLEWQQGPWIYDGSNGGRGRADCFPGWSAIVDEMMRNHEADTAELDEDGTDADAATQEKAS